MAKVYVAGPMRGYPRFNFPAFDAASALGRGLGWTVISPAEMDRDGGFNEDTSKASFEPAEIREFIRRDVNILVNVLKAEEGDAIALLPGWQQSTGARSELALAIWAKLRVLDATTFEDLDARIIGYENRVQFCEDGTCNPLPRLEIAAVADHLANTK